MPIKGAFIVPHPPMILTEIGRGSEIQIVDTINSYLRVTMELRSIQPDAVVIISPHAQMKPGSFVVSGGPKAFGSFADFGVPALKTRTDYDQELASAIVDLSNNKGIPSELSEPGLLLDHATMIPLIYFRGRDYEFKIVRIAFSEMTLETHYEFGRIIREAADSLGKNVVVVASADLSHKLQKYGPYGFNEAGPIYDEMIRDICSRGALNEMVTFDNELRMNACECGHRSITVLGGAIEGLDLKPKVHSYDYVTGVGYMVCEFI